jgi:four helix bundle protein
MKYDLEERTARFGEEIIMFCKKIPQGVITSPLINQLVRAATSIGANYAEADDAESKKDFKHKIGICKKEAREAKHFLRMIACAAPETKGNARALFTEAKELNLIFNAINNKLK